jgi:hypothetical protein
MNEWKSIVAGGLLAGVVLIVVLDFIELYIKWRCGK